jgi:hypothetical protein
MGQIATNPAHIKAVERKTSIGWGCFFKGFCAAKIQNVVNTLSVKHHSTGSNNYSGQVK